MGLWILEESSVYPAILGTRHDWFCMDEAAVDRPLGLGGQALASSRASVLRISARSAGVHAGVWKVDILVATHAVLSSASTAFKDLGLAVVDEEQRFGVEQRDRLTSEFFPPSTFHPRRARAS